MSKTVYVVLSRSPSALSQMIHVIKGDVYTHAAISLDRDLEYMFSFGRRWASNPFIGCFKRENLRDNFYKTLNQLPGKVIAVKVTDEQYCGIIADLEHFLLDSHLYDYNYIGLCANLFHRDYTSKERHYYCAEFVYHVLRKNGICELGISEGTIRAQDLMQVGGETIFEGNLKQYHQAMLNQTPVQNLPEPVNYGQGKYSVKRLLFASLTHLSGKL